MRISWPLSWRAGHAAHVLSGDEVALLSETGSVALRGRAHAAIAGQIDGTRTAEEVVARVNGDLDPAVVYYALLRLMKAGYLVEGAVAASGGLPPQTRDGFLVTDEYLRPELGERVRAELAAGCSVIPCRPVGAAVWIGPVLRPGDEAVWELLVSRLRLNRRADAAAVDAGAGFPLFPVDASQRAVEEGLAIAQGVHAGAELVTVHRASGEVTVHPIAELSSGRRDDRVVLRAAPKRYVADGGHRTVVPKESLARMERFTSGLTGVVTPPERLEGGAALPVYVAAHAGAPSRPAHGPRLRRPNGCAGKGLTDVQARASCLGEGIERYSCGFFGDEPRRRGRMAELGEDAIDPREVLLFSEAQYAERDAGRAPTQGFNAVPNRFDPGAEIEWTPVRSLTTGEERWLPSALCFFGYADPDGDPRFAAPDSNGAAAGNTLEEAILQGLLELIERDAVALWWYPRTRQRAIDLASFGDRRMDAVAEAHAARGRELRLLELTSDTGVPTVAALSWERESGGHIDLGLGAHLDPAIAVSRALSELEQCQRSVETSELTPLIEHAAWLAEATVETEPYVLPADDLPALRADELPRVAHDDLREDIAWCVRTLEGLGHEVLVYDHTRPDLGFPVVRVVAPGLRHFWKRLAPGRLYDVPVRLGQVTAPLTEEDLNPIGFFL